MLKKMMSFAAMLSTSLTVASCQTAIYKPIICEPGTALRQGKCQPVQRKATKAPQAKKAQEISTLDQRVKQAPPPAPRQNVYGQPIQ